MFLLFNSSARPQILRTVSIRSSAKSISLLSCLMKSHYECLGVSRNATQSDIKAAYYKLSMIYHPDRNETSEAADTFREITEAYEVIGNFKLRKMYDKGLLGNLGTEDRSRRSYTSYNPSASYYKNKPTHHDRTSAYNFDEWSQFHYGDILNKRQEAKVKYEEKINQASKQNGQTKNENVLYTMFVLAALGFLLSYHYKDSYDESYKNSSKKS